jgi:hypothetical protein
MHLKTLLKCNVRIRSFVVNASPKAFFLSSPIQILDPLLS